MSVLRDRAVAGVLAESWLSPASREWWERATERHATRDWCEATGRPGIWLGGSRTDALLHEYLEAFLGVRVVSEDDLSDLPGNWGSFQTFPPDVADEITAADRCFGALLPDQLAAELRSDRR